MSLEKYIKEYSEETLIFDEGDLGDKMYIVKEGTIRIELNVKNSNDENEIKILGKLEKGEFFGEMALIDDSSRSARAVSETHSQLVLLNKNRFYKLIESSPEFAIKIVRKISTRLKEANERMREVAKLKKESKILHFLVEFIFETGVDNVLEYEEFFELLKKENYKKDEVEPILLKLSDLDLIKIDQNKRIEIIDENGLKKIVRFLMSIENKD